MRLCDTFPMRLFRQQVQSNCKVADNWPQCSPRHAAPHVQEQRNSHGINKSIYEDVPLVFDDCGSVNAVNGSHARRGDVQVGPGQGKREGETSQDYDESEGGRQSDDQPEATPDMRSAIPDAPSVPAFATVLITRPTITNINVHADIMKM